MDNSYTIKRSVSRVHVLVVPDMGCMCVCYSVGRPCLGLGFSMCTQKDAPVCVMHMWVACGCVC